MPTYATCYRHDSAPLFCNCFFFFALLLAGGAGVLMGDSLCEWGAWSEGCMEALGGVYSARVVGAGGQRVYPAFFG